MAETSQSLDDEERLPWERQPQPRPSAAADEQSPEAAFELRIGDAVEEEACMHGGSWTLLSAADRRPVMDAETNAPSGWIVIAQSAGRGEQMEICLDAPHAVRKASYVPPPPAEPTPPPLNIRERRQEVVVEREVVETHTQEVETTWEANSRLQALRTEVDVWRSRAEQGGYANQEELMRLQQHLQTARREADSAHSVGRRAQAENAEIREELNTERKRSRWLYATICASLLGNIGFLAHNADVFTKDSKPGNAKEPTPALVKEAKPPAIKDDPKNPAAAELTWAEYLLKEKTSPRKTDNVSDPVSSYKRSGGYRSVTPSEGYFKIEGDTDDTEFYKEQFRDEQRQKLLDAFEALSPLPKDPENENPRDPQPLDPLMFGHAFSNESSEPQRLRPDRPLSRSEMIELIKKSKMHVPYRSLQPSKK